MAEPQTDSEILQHYKKSGDLSLIGKLFTRYTSLVYGVCLKYLKDRESAKDAVMQVFEKLISSLKSHEVENFKGWLYVTARNHCLMELRHKKGKFMEEISSNFVESEFLLHLEVDEEQEEDLRKMEDCINKLVDGQQRCVRLFYLEEKCYKDIATMTGLDMNHVKSFIQNGKRNLKICMEGNG
ncbi:MAG: sigma-70 family RNA polymerase sigma factor [Bacteroidetes bacterium]|nr:sigma-70 family RNA polymerase sigma factor [Bacteroidota bacterium]